jgi:hypothetical protein
MGTSQVLLAPWLSTKIVCLPGANSDVKVVAIPLLPCALTH